MNNNSRVHGDTFEIWEERIYPNCTVYVLTEINTGIQRISWVNNDDNNERNDLYEEE